MRNNIFKIWEEIYAFKWLKYSHVKYKHFTVQLDTH